MGADTHTTRELGDIQTNRGRQQQPGTSTGDRAASVSQTPEQVAQKREIAYNRDMNHDTPML